MLLTFEVAVVERDANAVQSETFKEGRIFLLEKILKELRQLSYLTDINQLSTVRTLSKKNSDISLPIVSSRASRIWYSQPGYPTQRSARRLTRVNQLTRNEVLHTKGKG
jgi:hypothetical protein